MAMAEEDYCSSCFFCAIKDPNPRRRNRTLSAFFEAMPLRERDEDVLVMSSLWSIAMAGPDIPDLPSAGVLRCMAALVDKGLADPSWLFRRQNIYIPYYAAHVLGSYTIKLQPLALLAVDAGAVAPLLGLFRGRMSWVEQRAAVRALGHLASYDATFPAVARHSEEVIRLAMDVACNCVHTVYKEFVAAKVRDKYHRDLLTRGLGGAEMEDAKAEEWAGQLRCWSIYLLSCFAWRNRTYRVRICRDADFLKKLSGMWGGGSSANRNSSAAAGLMRILCRCGIGRDTMATCPEVVDSLCNLSRSADPCQYMGIDCLVLLVSDPITKPKVRGVVLPCLLELCELRSLGRRKNVGKSITAALLSNFDADDLRESPVECARKEEALTDEALTKRMTSAVAMRKKGNEAFFSGNVEKAIACYTEALSQCPTRMRRDRLVLYSNRAQCRLLVQDPDAAISDATRALSLLSPANGHGRSLWRRAQAYDMKGMAKESLADCLAFVGERANVPYYAVRMISKQMSAAGLFASPAVRMNREGAKVDSTISGFGLPTIEEETRPC